MIFWLILIFLAVSLVAALLVIAPAVFSRSEGRNASKYWVAGIAGTAILFSGLGLYAYVGRPEYALLSLRAQTSRSMRWRRNRDQW